MQRYRRGGQGELNFHTGKGFYDEIDDSTDESSKKSEVLKEEIEAPLDHLHEVLWYIASHYDSFDFDFTAEFVAVSEQIERRAAILKALNIVLGEEIDETLQERYIKAVLEQLKKGIKIEPASSSRGASGRLLSGAQGNELRTRYRTGK